MNKEPGNVIEEPPQQPAKMPAEQKRILTQRQKVQRLLIGFLGWWAINIPLWMAIRPNSGGEATVLCILPFVFGLNVFLLIFMAIKERWVGLGLLAAFAVNLLVSLILGLTTNGTCWVPFTTPLD